LALVPGSRWTRCCSTQGTMTWEAGRQYSGVESTALT